MTLDSDDLHVSDAKGLVHVVTRSKDIDLSEIYGDTSVESSNGTISVDAGRSVQRGCEERQRRH